jgi:hypothetical protein
VVGDVSDKWKGERGKRKEPTSPPAPLQCLERGDRKRIEPQRTEKNGRGKDGQDNAISQMDTTFQAVGTPYMASVQQARIVRGHDIPRPL